jgi:hypothetical protein
MFLGDPGGHYPEVTLTGGKGDALVLKYKSPVIDQILGQNITDLRESSLTVSSGRHGASLPTATDARIREFYNFKFEADRQDALWSGLYGALVAAGEAPFLNPLESGLVGLTQIPGSLAAVRADAEQWRIANESKERAGYASLMHLFGAVVSDGSASAQLFLVPTPETLAIIKKFAELVPASSPFWNDERLTNSESPLTGPPTVGQVLDDPNAVAEALGLLELKDPATWLAITSAGGQ